MPGPAADSETFTDFLLRRLDSDLDAALGQAGSSEVHQHIEKTWGGASSYLPDVAKIQFLARAMAVPGIPIGPQRATIGNGPRLPARSILPSEPPPVRAAAATRPLVATDPPLGSSSSAPALLVLAGRDAAPAAQAGRRSRLQQSLAAHLQRGRAAEGEPGPASPGAASPRATSPEPLGHFAEPTDSWSAFAKERAEEIQHMKRSPSPRAMRMGSAGARQAKQQQAAAPITAAALLRALAASNAPGPEPAEEVRHVDKATAEAKKRRKQYEAIVIALTTALKENDEQKFIEVYDSIPKEFSATEVEQMKLDARFNAGLGGSAPVARIADDGPAGRSAVFTGGGKKKEEAKGGRRSPGKGLSRRRSVAKLDLGQNLAKGGSPGKAAGATTARGANTARARPALTKTATTPQLPVEGAPRSWTDAAHAGRRASRVAVLNRRASATLKNFAPPSKESLGR